MWPANIFLSLFGPCAQMVSRHCSNLCYEGLQAMFFGAINALSGLRRNLQPKMLFRRQQVFLQQYAVTFLHESVKLSRHCDRHCRPSSTDVDCSWFSGVLDSLEHFRFRDKWSTPDIIKTRISLFYILQFYVGRRDSKFPSRKINISILTIILESYMKHALRRRVQNLRRKSWREETHWET
jgi:hypothetical protein